MSGTEGDKVMTTGRCRVRADPPVDDLARRTHKGHKQASDSRIERCARWSGPSAVATDSAVPVPTAPARASGCSWWTSLRQLAIQLRSLAACRHHAVGIRRGPARRAPTPRSWAGPGRREPHGGETRTAGHELVKGRAQRGSPRSLTHLRPRCQQLLGMLIEDPPVPHAAISAKRLNPGPLSRPGWSLNPKERGNKGVFRRR